MLPMHRERGSTFSPETEEVTLNLAISKKEDFTDRHRAELQANETKGKPCEQKHSEWFC